MLPWLFRPDGCFALHYNALHGEPRTRNSLADLLTSSDKKLLRSACPFSCNLGAACAVGVGNFQQIDNDQRLHLHQFSRAGPGWALSPNYYAQLPGKRLFASNDHFFQASLQLEKKCTEVLTKEKLEGSRALVCVCNGEGRSFLVTAQPPIWMLRYC